MKSTSTPTINTESVAARLGLQQSTIEDVLTNLRMPANVREPQASEYIDASEAAARLGLKIETLIDLIAAGRLSAVIEPTAKESPINPSDSVRGSV